MSMRNKISHIFFVLIYCFQNIDGRIFEGSWWYLSYVEKSTFEASNLPVVKESTFSELVCNLEANSNETIEAYCLVDNQCIDYPLNNKLRLFRLNWLLSYKLAQKK